MTEVAAKTHALLSPSGAHRWTRCAGSVVLEQGQDDTGSAHARWGTCVHEVGALVLSSAVKTADDGAYTREFWEPENAEAYIGRVFQIDGHDVEFDMEMADCVNDYVAHVESFWEPGDILLVEQAVPLAHITGEVGATGTSDCIILKLHAREIVVIDLKGGRGVQVDAEDEENDAEGEPLLNQQGAMYGDGAREEHDLIYGPFDRVRIVIIQPRLNHVSEVVATPERLARNIALIRARASSAMSYLAINRQGALIPDSSLAPGEKQCKFCSAKAICPALEGAVSEALALTAPPARADEFPDLSIGKQAAAAVPEQPIKVDGTRLAKAWKAIPLVELWANAVRDAVHEALHDGKEVGDLCLYEGRAGARAWADVAAAEATLKAAKVKVDEMYDRKLISPTEAEKRLAKSRKPLWAKLAPLISRSETQPVVGVQGDPKRKVWSPARPEEFPDLDACPDELFT